MRINIGKVYIIMIFISLVGCLCMPTQSWAIGGLCSTDDQCDDGLWCNGPEMCVPADARADVNGCIPGIKPAHPRARGAATWRCDERQDRFVIVGADADGDGHNSIETGGDDCDDHNAHRYPGNVEICDTRGLDEDCDPTTVGHKDSDHDGYTDSACYNTNPANRSRIYDTRKH